MADSAAKKVAEQAEDRLEKVAENVREKFEGITGRRFSDAVRDGRFADQVDHGVDRGRADVKRREQGGSPD
ncbi:hypothetical protein ACFO0M_22980 [Micromonospora mangrovi]|uniref:Antitoxin n=2 Tax=Micromonospora TaxID=1873 RepID=A0AAU8H9H9_9ACTN